MDRRNKLTRDEIAAIQARIATETADELAAVFGVHRSAIWKWTKGLERARRRRAITVVTDWALLSMASRLKQVEIARQLGVTPTAIGVRLKRIRERGARRYDKFVVQERANFGGGARRAAGRTGRRDRHGQGLATGERGAEA